jgi:hypothetical protein
MRTGFRSLPLKRKQPDAAGPGVEASRFKNHRYISLVQLRIGTV